MIPEGWSVATLKEIGTFSKGRGIKKDDVLEVGIPCIRYGQIYTEFENVIKHVRTFVSGTVAKSSRQLAAGEILFAGSGETKEEIGKCVAYIEDVGAVAGGDIVILTPKGADSCFLGFALNAHDMVVQKTERAQGDAVVHISASSLATIQVLLPPLDEQQAIAEALSDADALVESLDALIAKKRDMKQAAMQQLLTGRTRLPGFSEEWREIRLGEVFAFQRTVALSRAKLSDGAPCGYIHYGDIHTRWNTHLDLGIHELPSCALELVPSATRVADGDLVLADASEDLDGVGKAVEVRNVGERTVVAGLHTVLMRPKPQTFAPGFAGLLTSMPAFVTQARTLAAGLKVFGLSKSSLATITVFLPPKLEQHAIAEVLSDMDSEIDTLVAQREKAELVKQGMMQELLSGRVRLV